MVQNNNQSQYIAKHSLPEDVLKFLLIPSSTKSN